jgi:hypothetical protein
VNLFLLGLRRSGTTIVHDALLEDPGLCCLYEPLREDAETIGGGSGAREEDAFAATRELRERFRTERYPHLQPADFNWGGPRAPELELEPDLPAHVAELLAYLLAQAPAVAIKETRLHHKLGALAEIDPEAAVVHVLRDPRAMTASMLLGRRRRTDLYPDAEAFFSVRTDRRLWSSRRLSEAVIERRRELALPADLPDFLRPLLVWKFAVEATEADGAARFGDRFSRLRLEDLRSDPRAELGRVYGLLGRPAPEPVVEWASRKIEPEAPVHLEADPRWGRAARLLGMEEQLRRAGYAEVPATDDGDSLDLGPPRGGSRLAGFVGRARQRLAER